MMADAMKIGVISQWYFPEPVLIPKNVSDASIADGNSVRVLTGFPNYPDGVIYPGFEGKTSQEESVESVHILRVRSFVSHDQSAFRRMRSFLSFALNSVKSSHFLSDRDVIYVYGTPMTAVTAAVYLRLTKRIPFIIHVQDLWPESVVDSGMLKSELITKAVQATLRAFLRPVYNLAQHIVVISPGMMETLIRRQVEPRKISVLLNWHAGESDVIRNPPASRSERGPVRCVYAGNIGVMQDVETIIRAAVLVQDELDLEVIIYGSGVAESSARNLAHELGAQNVKFMGRIAMTEMQTVYEQSDFQLVTLKDREVFKHTIPSKFQASLAHGVPVITTVAGDLASLCINEGIGLAADPENSSSLADTFRQAVFLGPEERAKMAKRSFEFYCTQMSAANATKTIQALMRDAVESRVGHQNTEPKGKKYE